MTLPKKIAFHDEPMLRDSAPQTSWRIVVVDEELPYPINSGKRARTLGLLLPLARRHRIVYLCHPSVVPEETRQAVEFFSHHGIETVLINRRLPSKTGLRFYGRLLGNLASPLPYSVQVHNSRVLRRAIRRYASQHQVDLWHCEWTPYGETLRTAVPGPWVVMAHNVESLIWQRYYENESNPLKRWYIKRQWKKFERFERKMFSLAGQTVAVSDPDAELMRTRFGATRVSVVDNGVAADHFRYDGSARRSHEILFLGSLDWRPNLDAVDRLLSNIFPRVLAHERLARLTIVGRKPPDWLTERVRKSPNVEIHADVPDVRPFLHQCGLMVVPLRIGGGSRLKIIEALAAECPVISTRTGAEGLRLQPGKHLVQVENCDDMADAIVACLRDPDPIRQMARRGRELVVDHYDWSTLTEQLDAIWRAEIWKWKTTGCNGTT